MTFQNRGRLAGFVYFLLVLTGIFNLVYVPTQIINWSDAAQTVANIKSSELLFRAGIVTGIFSYVLYLILPLLLFDIFKNIDRRMAVLMVTLACASVPISIFNIVDKVNILTLLGDDPYLKTLTPEQIQTQVMLLLDSYNNGIAVVKIFWGLWLFPFGYLIFKSGYAPKVLGIFLMLGCFGYVFIFATRLMCPDTIIPSLISKPATIGEIGTCLWLLIMGVKAQTDKAENHTNSIK